MLTDVALEHFQPVKTVTDLTYTVFAEMDDASGRSSVNRIRDTAAETIQAAARNRLARNNGRILRSLWPSIEKLRTQYVTRAVKRNGGQRRTHYDDEALCLREALKVHPTVEAAIEEAWLAFTSDHVASAASERFMTKDRYFSMARRIYLVQQLTAGNDLEPRRCIEAATTDWLNDAAGKEYMDFDDFKKAFFQLIDLSAVGISATAYKRFAGMLVRSTMRPGSAPGRWEWRDDLEIIADKTLARQARPPLVTRIEDNRPRTAEANGSRGNRDRARRASLPGGSQLPDVMKHQPAVSIFDRTHWQASFALAQHEEAVAAGRITTAYRLTTDGKRTRRARSVGRQLRVKNAKPARRTSLKQLPPLANVPAAGADHGAWPASVAAARALTCSMPEPAASDDAAAAARLAEEDTRCNTVAVGSIRSRLRRRAAMRHVLERTPSCNTPRHKAKRHWLVTGNAIRALVRLATSAPKQPARVDSALFTSVAGNSPDAVLRRAGSSYIG